VVSPHQDVSLILLQILDEGTITDSQGRKVDFKVMPFSPITLSII
jgi:ATP-dependent Clp protease ATP-binding subunit ClpA